MGGVCKKSTQLYQQETQSALSPTLMAWHLAPPLFPLFVVGATLHSLTKHPKAPLPRPKVSGAECSQHTPQCCVPHCQFNSQQ
jgi:hypothetical protein